MVGQVLLLKREPDNCEDRYAVAIVYADKVVGPCPLQPGEECISLPLEECQ